MNVHFPVRQSRWPGRLVQLAVVLVVAAMAAATFMLSYAGVHAIALQAGVPRELARFYPGVLDAALVIACAAAPALRGARWWARCYAWLAILVVATVIGGIDAVHAMSVTLPHRATAGVAAVLPWALLLLAFSLWLTIGAHQGGQRTARSPEPAGAPEETLTPTAVEAAAEPAIAAEAAISAGTAIAVAEEEVPADHGPDGADHAAEAGSASPDAGSTPSAQEATPADTGPAPGAAPDGEAEREPAAPSPEGAVEVPAITYTTGPRLRRVRSLPAPPVDEDE